MKLSLYRSRYTSFLCILVYCFPFLAHFLFVGEVNVVAIEFMFTGEVATICY